MLPVHLRSLGLIEHGTQGYCLSVLTIISIAADFLNVDASPFPAFLVPSCAHLEAYPTWKASLQTRILQACSLTNVQANVYTSYLETVSTSRLTNWREGAAVPRFILGSRHSGHQSPQDDTTFRKKTNLAAHHGYVLSLRRHVITHSVLSTAFVHEGLEAAIPSTGNMFEAISVLA